ncbi:MAG: DUF4230 domain-containing protein [Flavobacteriales bacterium]
MLEFTFIAITLLAISLVVIKLVRKSAAKNNVEHEAHILLEEVKKVCKLVCVEGDFQEIFDTRSEKSHFFNTIKSQKKALLIVKAKALVGFDLSTLVFDLKTDEKTIILSHFPHSKLISLETDIQFYDISKGLFSRHSEVDLTELHNKSKELIVKKVELSKLHDLAKHQAMELLNLTAKMSKILGWTILFEQPKQAKLHQEPSKVLEQSDH